MLVVTTERVVGYEIEEVLGHVFGVIGQTLSDIVACGTAVRLKRAGGA